VNTIDDPSMNDNRNYDFTRFPNSERREFQIISNLISLNSSVIDLGCGNGTLLQRLQKERSAKVKGVELTSSGVQACITKGLDVIQGRIDERLPIADNSFDYAICNVTIQMVMYPEVLLSEMKRISRLQIVSFPNFAFYRNRIQYIMQGTMPTEMLFDYQWYNTGHIHQLSLIDFRHLVQNVGGLIERGLYTVPDPHSFKQVLIETFPNLFMLLPIILLEKMERAR
jgi:methionine biosynthesis protein MetW